jgi:hypothetical protein
VPKQEKISTGRAMSHVMANCGDNIYDKVVVWITASSVSDNDPECAPVNPAYAGGDRYFSSENEPGQGIYWGFKSLRIKPTHDTIQTQEYCDPLKN